MSTKYFHLIKTLVLVVLSEYNCYSQNLIANGSFEDENVCTEFNAKCTPEAWMTASPCIPLYQGKSNKSIAFEIFNTSVPNTRKYIQTKLLCPLIKDKRYRFSLKLKLELHKLNQSVLCSLILYFSLTGIS